MIGLLVRFVLLAVVAVLAFNWARQDENWGPVIERLKTLTAEASSDHRNDERCRPRRGVKVVVLEDARYPQTTDHIQDLKGECRVLTWAPAGADARRRVAMADWRRRGGRPCRRGYDRDEWLPAAAVPYPPIPRPPSRIRCIRASDNRGAGSVMGNALRGHAGGRFVIDVR